MSLVLATLAATLEPTRCGGLRVIALQNPRAHESPGAAPAIRGFTGDRRSDPILEEHGIVLLRQQLEGPASELATSPEPWIALPLRCDHGVLGVPTNDVVVKFADATKVSERQLRVRARRRGFRVRILQRPTAMSGARWVVRIIDGSARDATRLASELKTIFPGSVRYAEVSYVRVSQDPVRGAEIPAPAERPGDGGENSSQGQGGKK